MDIHVFDKELSYIDNIDMLTSLIWTRRYYTAGKFELHCPITSHNISTLARNNLIWKQDSNEVGIIEYRRLYTDENGEEIITVVGRMLTSILDRRILYTTEQHTNKNVEIIMRNMVDKNCISTSEKRKLPIILGELKGYTERADYQKTYGNLLEELTALSQASDIGFLIRTDMENKKHYFECYKGIDRSIDQEENSHVVFSRENDNLYKQEYIDDVLNLRTTALVAGEGEGAERKRTVVNDEYTGLDRYELYVDARDIQQTVDDVTMPDSEYLNLLRQRGKEKLAECKDIQTFEGTIVTNNYEYGKDFDLGDIVTVIDKRWNVIVNTRITEVNEIYENGKVEIVPTLGNNIPTILDKIKRTVIR